MAAISLSGSTITTRLKAAPGCQQYRPRRRLSVKGQSKAADEKREGSPLVSHQPHVSENAEAEGKTTWRDSKPGSNVSRRGLVLSHGAPGSWDSGGVGKPVVMRFSVTGSEERWFLWYQGWEVRLEINGSRVMELLAVHDFI